MGAGQSNEEKLNMNMACSCLFDALVGAITADHYLVRWQRLVSFYE